MDDIGIIGNGFVGGAVRNGFSTVYNTFTYDTNTEKSTHTIEDIINNCKFVFLCLPTPTKENGEIDLSYICDAFESIKKYDTSNNIFIIKSTTIPGTCDLLSEQFNIIIVSNPEFLTERYANQEFLNARSIIIGSNSTNISEQIKNIYLPLNKNTNFILTDTKTAEMIKYTTNCFFASKIILMNEFYNICKAADIDFNTVKQGILSDSRIFPMHMDVPGHDGKYGYGGKCFPKDISALTSYAKKLNVQVEVLSSVIQANKRLRTQ